jgi:hypothetical protein
MRGGRAAARALGGALAFAVTMLAASSSAAPTATAGATATIARSSGATMVTQFAFGTVDASGNNNGTVTVTPASPTTHTSTGFKSTPTGTFTAVQYSLTGTPNATYTITLPSSITGSGSSTVDTFVIFTATLGSNSTTGKFSPTGTDTVYVGGTAHVGNNFKGAVTATLSPVFGF